jgi:hypothetical protein
MELLLLLPVMLLFFALTTAVGLALAIGITIGIDWLVNLYSHYSLRTLFATMTVAALLLGTIAATMLRGS